ncbi:MAG UNVERIFIED_CONTAM: hypothetical protein LVR18_26400 [Planctomycetaceae bacterium]
MNSCRLAALLVALSGIQTFTGDESAMSRVAAAPPFPSVFPSHGGDKAKMPQLISLPPLPDPEGFAGGYLGVTGDHLLFAGGADFPGKKPWEGGTKVWSAKVFAAAAVCTSKGRPQRRLATGWRTAGPAGLWRVCHVE